jgi:hypothetical protein
MIKHPLLTVQVDPLRAIDQPVSCGTCKDFPTSGQRGAAVGLPAV